MISRMKRFFGGGQMTGLLMLFGIEGVLLQFMMSINSFGNNLYATNMGASDSAIGLIQLIPNLAACVLLLPLGMVSDRMKSSRTMPVILLTVLGAAYFGFGTVPVLGGARMTVFFVLLALTVGCIAMYSAQWQTFFGDATPITARNRVYAFRNQAMFVIAVASPLLCGVLMSSQPLQEGKLNVLRIFFYISGAAAWLQALVLLRMPSCRRAPEETVRVPLRESLPAVAKVVTGKRFLLFIIPMVLFYMSWQLDWSMWYLGQVNYVHMNETELSVYNALFNVGQLLAIGFMSKMVKRKSPDYAVVIGAAGLISCPLIMFISTKLPHTAAFWFFTAAMTILDAPQCVIPLCALQILLDISPRQNRALIMNLYTLLITLSNSLLPYLGVQLYIAFGSNLTGLYLFNLTVLLARICFTALLAWRYLYLKKRGELTVVA